MYTGYTNTRLQIGFNAWLFGTLQALTYSCVFYHCHCQVQVTTSAVMFLILHQPREVALDLIEMQHFSIFLAVVTSLSYLVWVRGKHCILTCTSYVHICIKLHITACYSTHKGYNHN